MEKWLKCGVLLILVSLNLYSFSQGFVQGTFPQLANQTIQLIGNEGFEHYLIKSVKANDNGEFTIDYFPSDNGVGYLQSEDGTQFLLILNHERIVLEGIDFKKTDAVKTVESFENKTFERYMNEHTQREQVMAGWDYLKRIYQSDESLFSNHVEIKEEILKERRRIQREDEEFLKNLPEDSYAYWYLPIQKLISSVSTIAQYRTEEIPETTEAFRKIDYADNLLYKSGLLNDVLENQIWFIENSEYEQEEMYRQMGVSMDAILETLITNERRYNEIVERLFKILEKRSLYKASEYLALKVLNQKNCTVNNDLAHQLEQYRAMKIGNVAPDILFKGDLIAPNASKKPRKLSDVRSKFTVLFFGASWCPACREELPQLVQVYEKWKAQNVEILFISLDEEKHTFLNFTKIFPFMSFCDYKKWKSQSAQDYHVFATPTIYFLGKNREIILRPQSIRQMDAWVDWNLVNKN